MHANVILKWFKKRYIPHLSYIVFGAILFVCLCITFNTYVLHLKIETAVVSAPIEPIVAPATGRIIELFVVAGQEVKKDTPLLRIENLELEKELQMAQLQVEEAKLNISYYQHLLSNEQSRLAVYEKVGINRLAEAQAMFGLSKQSFDNIKKNLVRMQALHKRHYISDAQWDSELSNYYAAKEKLKSASAQQQLESHSLSSISMGMYFTGTKLEGKEQDLKAEIETAQKRLQVNQEKVKIYKTMMQKLVLLAPFDGNVIQVFKSLGNTVDTVKPVLLIEQNKVKKEIIAYLTQREITHLQIHTKVKIYIPSIGKIYLGHVVEINRTSGFIDEINAQYRWRDLYVDRSAIALIHIDEKDQVTFNQDVIAGMPAIVYFSKKFTTYVIPAGF